MNPNLAILSERTNPIVILGNGPSTKSVDFNSFGDGFAHSIGMNAAYRYWEKIDFRPTYYICMDTVVIKSHAGRIAELIKEERIKAFFLRNELLELHPELARHPNILWFDDVRAKKSSIFDTNFITTGSWSIRWAAHLGYREILLIGIDANYVELLPEAEKVNGSNRLELQLRATPKFNPNYFFDDYQQAGDRYNVPNDPGYREKAGGLVHVEALRKAKDDISKIYEQCDVIDCSPISTHGIFRKGDLQRWIAGRQITLVTSFFTSASKDEVVNNAKIAILNARNDGIKSVTVLLEGGKKEFFDKIGRELTDQWIDLESENRLIISLTDVRPNYYQLFKLAQEQGGGKLCGIK